MSNQKRWYFEQLVTEGDLNEAFRDLEAADQALITDQSYSGVYQGYSVAQATVPDLTVDIAGASTAYDQFGQRCFNPSLVNLDLSVDSNAASTAVSNPGNEKWLSVFVQFDRNLSDQRFDGNGSPVFFREDESVSFVVVQGAEATAGAATRPSLLSDAILIADVLIEFGTTAIVNGATTTSVPRIESADTTAKPASRFQYAFNLTSSSPGIVRAGPLPDAMQDILTQLNNHINGASNLHDATVIDWAGGAAWLDGTTNPATDVGTQLAKFITDLTDNTNNASGGDKISLDPDASWAAGSTANTYQSATTVKGGTDAIVADLASSTSSTNCGGQRVGVNVQSNWANSGSIAGNTVTEVFDEIVTSLADTNANPLLSGAARIGCGPTTALSADTLQNDLAALDVGWGKLDRANTWTASQTFDAGAVVRGSELRQIETGQEGNVIWDRGEAFVGASASNAVIVADISSGYLSSDYLVIEGMISARSTSNNANAQFNKFMIMCARSGTAPTVTFDALEYQEVSNTDGTTPDMLTGAGPSAAGAINYNVNGVASTGAVQLRVTSTQVGDSIDLMIAWKILKTSAT